MDDAERELYTIWCKTLVSCNHSGFLYVVTKANVPYLASRYDTLERQGPNSIGGYMSKRQVMQQALTFLTKDYFSHTLLKRNVVAALQEELAKPEPEPVGYVTKEDRDRVASGKSTVLNIMKSGVATYAIPIYRREDL